MFAPYWVSYPEQVLLAGGRPVVVPTRDEDGFPPDPDLLAKAHHPADPGGHLQQPEQSHRSGASEGEPPRACGGDGRPPDVLVITDDIYEHLLYTGHRFVDIANVAPALRGRTLVVNGMSKAYAMTGWRMGYAAGPKALVGGMQLVQDQSTSNVNSITQRAALGALNGPQEPIRAMVKEFHQRRDLAPRRPDPDPRRALRPAGGGLLRLPGRDRVDREDLEGQEARLGARHLGAAAGGPPGGGGAGRAVRGAGASPAVLRRVAGHPGEGAAADAGLRRRPELNGLRTQPRCARRLRVPRPRPPGTPLTACA